MIKRIKEFTALLSGLAALLLPIPIGGNGVFKAPTTACIFAGVITALYLFYAKEKHWPKSSITSEKKAITLALLLLLASFILYFTLYKSIDTPSKFIIAVEVISYSVFVFLLAALTSLLAELIVIGQQGR